MKTRTISIGIICAAALFSGGFLTAKQFPNFATAAAGKLVPIDTDLRAKDAIYTNPLLDCSNATDVDFTELKPFKGQVTSVINANIANRNISSAAVYFRDLNNGPWFDINGDTPFYPASLLKVPLAMAYYKYAEDHPTVLDDQLTWHQNKNYTLNDLVGLTEGQAYSVRDLMARMLKDSDNAATDLLFNHLPADQFQRPYQDLGLALPATDGSYQISPHTYAKLFRVLYNASYLTRGASEEVLGMLAQSTFTEGIRAGVPASVQVANKYGERVAHDSTELHDCSVVYYPSHPYLLCIMAIGADEKLIAGVIADISQEIYKDVSQQLSN